MRQMVKSILKSDKKSSNQIDDAAPSADSKSYAPPVATEKKDVASLVMSKRPAWALTEEAAKVYVT